MDSSNSETAIGNARVVLADRVIEHGWVVLVDGRVAEIGEGAEPPGSEDAAGDIIMPGLVELHTDALEGHFVPRPKVFWDPMAAVISYDAQLATTKMFYAPADAVAFNSEEKLPATMQFVAQFLFDHGILGTNAASAEAVGMEFPGGKTLGDTGNTKLRFDPSFMATAAEGKL